jgi:ferritin
MLTEKMQEALNRQLNAELYSAYLYLSMAAYFDSLNLAGMSRWMRVQAKEEEDHALRFFDYLSDQRGRVKLAAVAAPATEWQSPLAAWQAAYEHEQKVTGMIQDLVKMAKEIGDTATGIFLQWFVTEQVEEEKQADEVVQKLKMVKEAPHGLLMLDGLLGQREG